MTKNCKTCGYKLDRYSPDGVHCSCVCKSISRLATIPSVKNALKVDTNSERSQNMSISQYDLLSKTTFEGKTPVFDELFFPNGLRRRDFVITAQKGKFTRYEPWYQVKEEVERRGEEFTE